MTGDERAAAEIGSQLLSAAAPSEVDECIALNTDQMHHLTSMPPLNSPTSTRRELLQLYKLFPSLRASNDRCVEVSHPDNKYICPAYPAPQTRETLKLLVLIPSAS